ncbi:MAG: hypothetical protein ABH852_02960 [Methanobacteriota archaeon]
MRRTIVGVTIGLTAFVAALAISYFVLNGFYGTEQVSYSTQIMTIEDYGQRITTGDAQFTVEDVELATDSRNASYYRLLVSPDSYLASGVPEEMAPAPAMSDQGLKGSSEQLYYVSVPVSNYDQAVQTGEPVTVSNLTLTETRPIDTLPIATSIGVAVGLVAAAIWFGYRQSWGEATSTLLEHGLHDMTVRDIEIVGHIMARGEFTIPGLMKLTEASKITVWRTVQKLEEKGLVERTEETKLAANGLGGRGKPSRIYKYIGEKPELKQKASPKLEEVS